MFTKNSEIIITAESPNLRMYTFYPQRPALHGFKCPINTTCMQPYINDITRASRVDCQHFNMTMQSKLNMYQHTTDNAKYEKEKKQTDMSSQVNNSRSHIQLQRNRQECQKIMCTSKDYFATWVGCHLTNNAQV